MTAARPRYCIGSASSTRLPARRTTVSTFSPRPIFLEQPPDQFALRHAGRIVVELHDHVVFLKAGVFARGVRAVLPDRFHEQRQLIFREATLVARGIIEILERQPASRHAAHWPGAGTP